MPINSKRKGKTGEVWRDIPGYEGLYKASNYGNIWSAPRKTTRGGVLSPQINPNGYAYVSLSKNGEIKTCRVHVLIARAFLGENQQGLQVNHIDGNKSNNAVDNLEYCTQSENMRHAFQTGLEQKRGEKVVDLDTLEIYQTLSDAARTFSNATNGGEMVARVCRGERSHYKNRRFAFYQDYINNTIPEYKGKYTRKASEALWR